MSSDCLHDTDVLSGHKDSDWQGEGLDDLGSPNIVKDKEAVWQMTRQEQSRDTETEQWPLLLL